MTKLYTEENTEAPYSELNVTEGDSPPMMSKPRTFLMNFTQFGLNFMVLLLSVVVVPAQVEALVGSSSKGRCLGGMVAGGAAVTFVVSPVIGMVSDRMRSKMGKRRPVMLAGTAIMCVGLVGMAFSSPQLTINVKGQLQNSTDGTPAANVSENCVRDLVAKRCLPFADNSSFAPDEFTSSSSGAQPGGVILPRKHQRYKSRTDVIDSDNPGNLGLYIVFFLMVVTSQATVSVPFNALVADKSNPSQRGFNSGVMGAMILLGNVAGAIAGLTFTHIGVLSIYGLIIGNMIVCITITILFTSETIGREDAEAKPLGCRTMFTSFWSPLKEHDFRWVFITRFLMQQGVATITGFLEYWLDDMMQLPRCWTAATSVALLLLPLLFSAAFSSIVFGVLSDRTGKRKAIVAGAAILMGAGSLCNAFLSGQSAYFVAVCVSFLIGIGFGAFQSVDFALVMDVLPEEREKAKDIAVWHQALVLPQALATPVGGLILDLFERVNCQIGLGYIILFLVTAVYFMLSGAFVFKIRRAQ
ncbi:uncharacterized protein [Littorina saxatilis]|uniref:Major facilitator superfamily (MFS) profile domain-containing protein n=1 Tax=Littorina saxatilis TaxID=31220 RepID=A0AAN9GM28_9CAEN